MSYICHAVGARPQFIKLAAVLSPMSEVLPCRILHTGQHYDRELSGDFFSQLRLPEPDWNLAVGSGPHGAQTGRMMERIEQALVDDRPVAMVVYGDTNSTLASALTAAKLNIPVIHIEAGLRSFDKTTPEEINRVATDHLSKLLFCPSPTSVRNLRTEGITEGVYQVGDVMLDILMKTTGSDPRSLRRASIEIRTSGGEEALLERGEYYLATLHRAENADDDHRISRILAALSALPKPVLFPVHPRTAGAMERLPGRADSRNLLLITPACYEEMLVYLANCRVLYTDSGGLQKEAYYVRVPCATLRDRTEWEETVEQSANVLVDDDGQRILAAADMKFPEAVRSGVYGDGAASERIARVVRSFVSSNGRKL